jgi:hypothetical protein
MEISKMNNTEKLIIKEVRKIDVATFKRDRDNLFFVINNLRETTDANDWIQSLDRIAAFLEVIGVRLQAERAGEAQAAFPKYEDCVNKIAACEKGSIQRSNAVSEMWIWINYIVDRGVKAPHHEQDIHEAELRQISKGDATYEVGFMFRDGRNGGRTFNSKAEAIDYAEHMRATANICSVIDIYENPDWNGKELPTPILGY